VKGKLGNGYLGMKVYNMFWLRSRQGYSISVVLLV